VEAEASSASEIARMEAELIVDQAPVLNTTPTEEGISAEEIRGISRAVSSLKAERTLSEEKAELEELKEDREDYVEVSINNHLRCFYLEAKLKVLH